MKKLYYICLQVTKEGQASYAHVNEIIKGLKELGWNVTLFQPKHIKVNQSILQRLISFLITQISLVIRIRKVKIIYMRSHFALLPTTLLAKLFRVKIVNEINGPYEDLFISWPFTRKFKNFFKWIISIQYKLSDGLIVVTPHLKEWVERETGNKNVCVIPNGANTEIFHPDASTEIKLPENYVVFFGALTRWQGIDTILKSVNSPDWPKDLNIVILGDGTEKDLVEKEARRNSLIHYLGKIPYVKVAGVIVKSIAGLSPQNNIGDRSKTGLFPLKVFETLACGVPVIVTDFPGQSDLVRKYNCGVIIKDNSSNDLVEAVKYLYQNPEERKGMGKRGRKAVVNGHSWFKRAEQTENFIGKLLEKP